MTWNEKADEISACILKKMKEYNAVTVEQALREAAIKGMEFDSYNWCNKIRNS